MSPSVLDLDLNSNLLPTERTLGVQWNMNSDMFTFKMTPKDKPFTRRGILSVTSSIYDPLGMVSPIILPAKRLLQDLCKQGLGWTLPRLLMGQSHTQDSLMRMAAHIAVSLLGNFA